MFLGLWSSESVGDCLPLSSYRWYGSPPPPPLNQHGRVILVCASPKVLRHLCVEAQQKCAMCKRQQTRDQLVPMLQRDHNRVAKDIYHTSQRRIERTRAPVCLRPHVRLGSLRVPNFVFCAGVLFLPTGRCPPCVYLSRIILRLHYPQSFTCTANRAQTAPPKHHNPASWTPHAGNAQGAGHTF
jgi:hypothetical protein